MNLRTLVVTGVVGIAILAAVALAGIFLLGRRSEPPRPPPAAPLEVPDPAALPPQTSPALAPAAVRPPPRPRSVAPAEAQAADGEGSAAWDAVPLAFRPAGLGVGLAAPVTKGLAEARQGWRPCFDEERRRRAGTRPDPAAAGAFGPAVLVVRLEAQPGKLVVAGTEIASRGTSSPELVECCRRSLAGYEMDAPAAAPPARYRVQLLLQ